MGVSTYSTANVRNGNLLTAVPIVSWQGLGPDMNFALVHNSAHVTSGVNLSHTNGFNLGPGWQTSYSTRLIFNSSTSTTVVHDDGRMDTYTKIANVWTAPPGVHDVLTQHMTSPRWRLDFKDQSSLEFNTLGRLAKVRDANGHALALTRDSQYRVYKITDAAQQDSNGSNDGRKLLFDYVTINGTVRLSKIIDLRAGDTYPYDYDSNRSETEAGAEPQGSDLTTRIWTLTYDTSDRLSKITDPMGFEVEIKSYDSAGRVTQIEDKDDDAFTYEYNADGQLWKVTDPNPGGGGTQYVQQFVYACPPDPRRTTYTDRRGKAWLYEFTSSNTLTKFTNPLGQDQEYVFDATRNLTSYKDALDKEWTFTYDTRGNLLKTFTPLMPNSGQNPTPKSERTYDALNNLSSVKDAAGNTVNIYYELTTTYPTLPTKITVPADGQGNGANDITISYYDSSTPTAAGQIKEVRQLAVRTGNDLRLAMFEYDAWGQPTRYGEGEIETPLPEWFPPRLDMTTMVESSSNPISSSHPSGGSSTGHNPNGWPITGVCAVVTGPGPSPPPGGLPQLPCGVPLMPEMDGGWDASEADDYSKMGQLKELVTNTGYSGDTREYTFAYDKLGRGTSAAINSTSENPDLDFSRGFSYAPEWADDGSVTRTGPDGKTTTITLDDAGRTATLSRDGVTGAYLYNTRGLLERINYGNGAHVEYEYDDDQRLLSVEHYDATPSLILGLVYQYNSRDLPTSITESNSQGTQAVVGFAYDNRGRLIGETRTGATPYDMEYAYDQAGNRTSKLDNAASLLTLYEYDVDDPVAYQSDNNRLMKSEMYDVSGTPVLVSTTWYYYYVDRVTYGYDEGNVNRIVTVDHTLPGAPRYTAVRMEYDKAQRVAFMLGEEWDEDGEDEGSCPDNYVINWAREFRYDAARARYLNRELDPGPNGLMHTPYAEFVALSETWTDYDGDESYGDFEIDAGPAIDNLRSFEPGLSAKDPDDQSSGVSYYHSDMLGTTRGMTSSSGASAATVAYTAFGEKITPGYHRYGYAGSWGYQAHDFPSGENVAPIPFMHVGWRYYDPGTGRFLQRDPIGIGGGVDVYAYVDSSPLSQVDSLGLAPLNWNWNWRIFGAAVSAGACRGAVKGFMLGSGVAGPPGSVAGTVAGGMAGGAGGAVVYAGAIACSCVWDIADARKNFNAMHDLADKNFNELIARTEHRRTLEKVLRHRPRRPPIVIEIPEIE